MTAKREESKRSDISEIISDNHDLTIKCANGEKLLVSKVVLSKHSAVFRSMFETGVETEFVDVAEDFAIVQEIMRYVHVPAYAKYVIPLGKEGKDADNLFTVSHNFSLLSFCDKYDMDVALSSLTKRLASIAKQTMGTHTKYWIDLLKLLTQKGHISVLRASIIHHFAQYEKLSSEAHVAILDVLTKPEIITFSIKHREALLAMSTGWERIARASSTQSAVKSVRELFKTRSP